jgi:small subunit ribosomal protein S1
MTEELMTDALGEDFASIFEASLRHSGQEGSVVKGSVVGVTRHHVLVDVGGKSEGMIPLREFSPNGEPVTVAVGDEVDVFLEKMESRGGKVILSRERALREVVWQDLENASTDRTPVEGAICGKVKGGFTVDLRGIVSFLPGSQVDIRPIRDITPLMGVVQPFLILKMDRKQGNIVVSRRAVLEDSRQDSRNEMLSQITEGQIIEGMVKNLTPYGAFIDLGCVDGLLHVTDIAWTRVNHPSEVLKIGDMVRVVVIKFSPENRRVSLGMKQLQENPWQSVTERYQVGQRYRGRVTNIADYGLFVELEPGIEGLVHVSEISWAKSNIHPRKLLSVGQEVDVAVLDIDPSKNRISLGIKQCSANPWVAFSEQHPVGSRVSGKVRNIVDFGMFIGFEGDIDGLVHVSDLSWDEAGEEALKRYQKDQSVQAVVLAVDTEKERISLGIKQLEARDEAASAGKDEGVWSQFKKNATITVRVQAVRSDGIEVELAEGVTSFIKKSELASDRAEQRPERFSPGDRVDAKITSLDRQAGRLSVSVRALEVDEHNRAIAEYGSTDSGASLGDILGEALARAKKAGQSDNN